MKPAIFAINFALLTVVGGLVAGCGLTQKVSESTVSLTKSIFYKQINTLHLDIKARHAINNNAQGTALSTVVRIYQLNDRKAFDSTDYASLFAADSMAIKADLLSQKDIRVRPGESVAIDIPLEKSAQYIAVAGMFISPDQENNTWRVVLKRDDLDADEARIIELNMQGLMLIPLEEK